MVKWYHTKRKGFRMTLEMDCNLQEYALNFLHIINNAREHQEMILKVENDYYGYVYVTVNAEHKESCFNYLEQFGSVDIKEIDLVILDYDYNEKAFNHLYSGDYTEFIFDSTV